MNCLTCGSEYCSCPSSQCSGPPGQRGPTGFTGPAGPIGPKGDLATNLHYLGISDGSAAPIPPTTAGYLVFSGEQASVQIEAAGDYLILAQGVVDGNGLSTAGNVDVIMGVYKQNHTPESVIRLQTIARIASALTLYSGALEQFSFSAIYENAVVDDILNFKGYYTGALSAGNLELIYGQIIALKIS